MTYEAVLLAGPTACGKSDLAVQLASANAGEVVSVDSCAVYRGMDIGSAKPDAGQRSRVVHHLLDIRSPDQRYSAGEFAQDAATACLDIRGRSRMPVLCGGTMLYVKTLLEGLSPIPRVPEHVRAKTITLVAQIGPEAAHRRLFEVDPVLAARLAPKDRQRIARALAVHAATAKALSTWQQQRGVPPLELKVLFAVLMPVDRDGLRERIRLRTEKMFAAGFVEEVRALADRYGCDAESMQAVGYRQVCEYLNSQCKLEDAKRKVFESTCQLARRQMTWLRRLEFRAQLVADPFADGIVDRISRMIA